MEKGGEQTKYSFTQNVALNIYANHQFQIIKSVFQASVHCNTKGNERLWVNCPLRSFLIKLFVNNNMRRSHKLDSIIIVSNWTSLNSTWLSRPLCGRGLLKRDIFLQIFKFRFSFIGHRNRLHERDYYFKCPIHELAQIVLLSLSKIVTWNMIEATFVT